MILGSQAAILAGIRGGHTKKYIFDKCSPKLISLNIPSLTEENIPNLRKLSIIIFVFFMRFS
jgi:hypothetical protein